MISKPKTEADFEYVLEVMKKASFIAMERTTPTPMIVGHPSTPLGNDVDPNQKTWYVPSGICGFASVKLPNRGNFAKWLKDKNLASTYGDKGLTLHGWAREGFADGGQSYEYNTAIAEAIAKVLNAYGFEARVWSYVD
jgi:hypothetical protein